MTERCRTNPRYENSNVLLDSASMAPSSLLWSPLLAWVASSSVMPQSARILTTTCTKPAVPLEDCRRQYGRIICSASPRRSSYTELSSFPSSCTVQRPELSTGSRQGYLSDFTNAACAQSLASKEVKRRSPKEGQPVQQRAYLASGAVALGLPCRKNRRHKHICLFA